MKQMRNILSVFFCSVFLMQTSFVNAASRLPGEMKKICVDREVFAKEIKTGKTKKFTSNCKIPEGWVPLGKGMPIDDEVKNIKPKLIDSEIMVKLTLSTSKNPSRKIVILSKDYEFSLSNTTYLSGVSKIQKKGPTSYLIIEADKSGEVYLSLKNTSGNAGDVVSILTQDGKEIHKTLISVRKGGYADSFVTWKILQ